MSRHLTELMVAEADDRMEIDIEHESRMLRSVDRMVRNYNLCQELESRGRTIDWDYFGVEDETGQLV